MIPRSQVRDVWADNLYKEVAYINEIIKIYNCVSVSTEFPGVVARPIGNFRSLDDFHYQTMRSNADIMNLIQLGLTFTDQDGNKPKNDAPSTFIFNFKFDLSTELYSSDSIDNLIKTGVNFTKHEQFGIDPSLFAKLLQGSGLCLDNEITWISYHAGYDLGFLISLLTNKEMPADNQDFQEWVNLYFPNVYDIKFISKKVFQDLSASKSLEYLCEELTAIPSSYIAADQFLAQVGGQSLLASICFHALKKMFHSKTNTNEAFENCKGLLWGITESSEENASLQLAQGSLNNKEMLDGGILSPKANNVSTYFTRRM